MKLGTLLAVAQATLIAGTVLAAGPKPQGPAAAQPAAAAPAGNAEIGKALYMKSGCAQCHGQEAQGGMAGSRLGPNPVPFKRFVSYSRAPSGEMPPYTAKVLSDQQWADIYAYVASRPKPPAVKDVPLLSRQK